MKEKIKKYLSKKEYIVFIIALIITISSFSYAFFISSDILGNNVATTECFKITLEDSNDINLDKAYPISESEGSSLTPYTFTIKNVCNKVADYQVNIETLSTTTIDTEYIRIKLDNNESNILKRYELNESNINNNVKEGRKITTGTLRANEEKTYSLRMWIDEESTIEQSANKEYHGKVTVIATPNKEVHDIEIAYIVDGVAQDAPPAKGTGYKLKNYECTNADAVWDRKEWSFKLINMVGKVKCNLEFEKMTEITVTLYSAAEDEVYYYDSNNEKNVIGTTDSTGKLENVNLELNDYTFYSSIAKNTDDLSQDFSKNISIDDDTENVYIMPDGDVYYWYGFDSNEMQVASTANGWTTHGAYTFLNPTFKNNSIKMTIGSNQTGAYGTISPKTYSNATIHYIGTTTTNSVVVTSSLQKTNYSPRTDIFTQSTTNTIQHLSALLNIENMYLIMTSHFIAGNMTHEFYAFWVD